MAETGFKKWIITVTVIVASLLELIDTTIVNVALPHIQGNLGATLEGCGLGGYRLCGSQRNCAAHVGLVG
jgi:hypothetical protein